MLQIPFKFPDQIYWFFGSLIASFICLISTILLIKKYHIKKTAILKNISITLLAFTSAIFADWICLLSDSYHPEIMVLGRSTVDLGTAISFSFDALANVFLLSFTEQVYYSDAKKSFFRTCLKIGEFGIIVLMVYTFVVVNKDLQLIVLIIHIFISLIIYGILTVRSFLLMARLKQEKPEDIVQIRSIGFIAISGIFLFISVILFVMHEVLLMISVREYYTLMFAWLLASIAAFCMYLGYVSPEWFKKFVNKKKEIKTF